MLTTVAQLYEAASDPRPSGYSFRIEGTVWWRRALEGRLVLADSTGAAALRLRIDGSLPRPGQRILLEGHGTVTRHGADLQLGAVGPIVDNDGEHAMTEKSGTVYLREGMNAFHLEWFNSLGDFGLALEYEGPGLERQPVPASALFQPTGAGAEPESGVAYRAYEGTWDSLPQFDGLVAVGTGVVPALGLSAMSRAENTALVFTGQLNVPRAGFYTFHLRSDDGSRWSVGGTTVSLTVVGEEGMPDPVPVAIGQTWNGDAPGVWAVLEGHVSSVKHGSTGTTLELGRGPARVRVEMGDGSEVPPGELVNCRVRVRGLCQPAFTAERERVPGLVLVPDSTQLDRVDPRPVAAAMEIELPGDGLPVLETAAEVHRLKREEAERGYPACVCGVVTSVLPEDQAFTLQDATRGIYVVDVSSRRSRPPRVGEFLAVEGITDPSLFAPIINARVVRSLGLGQMPAPVVPTWDQLMNGSLDAQFVEMQGIVTATRSNGVSLLTREGVIAIELRVPGMPADGLASVENALVRIRGCMLAFWDYVTHQVRMGEVRIYDAELSVDQPPPADLFDAPTKTLAELLQFDPQAGAFQRVKVSGQIVHVRDREHFMMQGDHGLRFLLTKSHQFAPGDEVEVVGFPELFGGSSPILREAVARTSGRASLPRPVLLAPEELGNAAHDSTLVQVEGLLTGARRSASELILEIQTGVRSFAARLQSADGALETLPAGTRLELRGVYASHSSTRQLRGEVAGFDLLVNSPADIRVLAKPPWWTLRHLLIIVGLLVCGLAVAILWVTQLRRQVEQRGAELAVQIKEREHAESQRTLEQERARIARDLHDELGSGITEISMLAARAKTVVASEERRGHYLDEAWSRARQMVTALDEIVWAMDPHHDSLASLVSYFSLYADRFLGLAGIAWRLEGPHEAADQVLDSHRRHQLFLVFKEALNNIVRHSGASEVRLHIDVNPGEMSLDLRDNGSGLPAGTDPGSISGIANMRLRIEKLGGRCEVGSAPGRGTNVRVILPWKRSA